MPRVTITNPSPTCTIELNDDERFQLSRILSWFRAAAHEDSPDYELSLDLSCAGIDSYMTKQGREHYS